MALTKYLMTTAAAIRPELPVRYEIKIDGKWVLTGGWVQSAVKTGDDEITVTVKHWKTGETHTNVLKAHWKIQIHLIALVNKGIAGSMTMWPTGDQITAVRSGLVACRDKFPAVEVGTEFLA